MRLIPLASILVPADRQRQAHDPTKHFELMSSIQSIGLLHPIIVRRSTEGVVLVAGERRMRAIKDIADLGGNYRFEGAHIHDSVMPTIDLGELTELEYTEAEHDENERREDLSWQERAAATSRLERLRRLQAISAGAPPPTVAELATELVGSSDGRYQEDTRRELIVAKHFDKPEVAGAKSLDEAWKFLKKEEEVKKRVELATKVGLTFTSAVHELHNVSCAEYLISCPNEQFDVILTDPPYGMGADNFGDAGGGNHPHEYRDDVQAMFEVLAAASAHAYRVAKPQAHLYWFCDIDHFHKIKAEFASSGWTVHRTPLVWHKPNGYLQPWPESGPHRTWEIILYAKKGDRPVNIRAADTLTFPTEAQSQGPQKPVELFKELLRRSARPGDSVIDLCCGSGPIFPAADALKCKAVGLEKMPATYALAMERLTKLKGDSK